MECHIAATKHWGKFYWARGIVIVGILLTASILAPGRDTHALAGDWPTYLMGNGSGFNGAETIITPATAPDLKQHWLRKAGGDISAQPIEANGLIYWGSWDGLEHASRLSDGSDVWSRNLGKVSSGLCNGSPHGVLSTATVSSLTINGMLTPVVFVGGGDTQLYALNANTGAIIWQTPLKVLPSDFLYGATTIFNGSVYISVASIGDCKPVPGRIVQVAALTGTIQHTFSDMPGSCLGGGVWGSPVINTTTGILFFATGNPAKKCSQPRPMAIALVALNAGDLSLVGSWQIPPSQWVNDSDFGSTPTLFQATINNVAMNMVGIANKNGIYYAFNQANISAGPWWQVQLAQGGAPDLGYGSISASAWDGTTLYAAGGVTTIKGQTCSGSVRALDPASGKFLWEACLTKAVLGAVTAVPGVIEVGSGPSIIVLRASDGSQLFSFQDKPSSRFWGPASISNGVLYQGNMNGNFYAFGL